MASLAAENAALKDKLARLGRLISRNSGNSSIAASSDDQPGRTPPKEKKPHGTRKRKPGKQPGAPGAHLAWNDDPDDTVPHFPVPSGTRYRTFDRWPCCGGRRRVR